MELLQQGTKRIVTHNPLPPTCGPICLLYDLATHKCVVSEIPKLANANCDYPAEQILAIVNNPKAVELLREGFQL